MNIDLSLSKGTTEFLNFSDALHHLRWGERIARRSWEKMYVVVTYYDLNPSIKVVSNDGLIGTSLSGRDIMAEDWYVLGEHQ